MNNSYQLHVFVENETMRELKKILPENRMVSMVVRKLLKSYIKDVKEGANPWCFLTLDTLMKGESSGIKEPIE